LARQSSRLPQQFFDGVIEAAKRQVAALDAYMHGGGGVDASHWHNYVLSRYERASTAPRGVADAVETVAPITPLLEAGTKVAVVGGAVAIISLGAAVFVTPASAWVAAAAGEEAAVFFGDRADDVARLIGEEAAPLFDGDRAVIEQAKVFDYVLNPEHPVGGDKARVFEAALGFTRSNGDLLIAQIRAGVLNNPARLGVVDVYGLRFTVDMPIIGPNGNGATVRTGWIYDPESVVPRLVTLFVV
jgi:hypothetical protein